MDDTETKLQKQPLMVAQQQQQALQKQDTEQVLNAIEVSTIDATGGYGAGIDDPNCDV